MCRDDERLRKRGCHLVEGDYELAGVPIRIRSQFSKVHEMCAGYRTRDVPLLVVETMMDDIELERERSSDVDPIVCYSDEYLETLAVYRKIADAMPDHGVLLVHGSAIAVDGECFLFCAPSGTGKSTHARLWRELLGPSATMVNDDKPLVRVEGGKAMVFGTPWDGKHHLSANVSAPLRAVCLLERSERNWISRTGAGESLTALLHHVYRPPDAVALSRTLSLLDGLIGCVDVWRLGCNMDIEAAELSFSAMRGA